MPILEVNNLQVYYGNIRALHGISFSVEDHPLLGETARWGVATAGRAP